MEEITLENGPKAGRIIACRGRIRAADPDLVTGVSFDVTEQRQLERALQASEAHYRQLFDSIDEGLCVIEVLFDDSGKAVDYRFLEINAAFERQTGLIEAVGRTMRSFEPDHEEHWFEIYGQIALTGEAMRFEHAAERLGRFYEVYAFRVGKPEERRVGILFNDISERRAAEKQRTLLIQELNHRVKNTLAVVQMLARQSLSGKDVPDSARRAFEGRLAALAGAHSLLTEASWEKALLRDVTESAIRACGPDMNHFSISGPPVTLQPQKAVAITMALHELCTNAIKYGALSRDGGRICVEWLISGENNPKLYFSWREEGGPSVTPPARRGFGFKMVEEALAHQMDATTHFEFRREGLVCTVEAPLTS